MDKIVGVLINEKIAKWQEEAMERIEKCGNKVVVFFLKKKPTVSSLSIKFLFFLERKILGSSDKYLKYVRTNERHNRIYYSLDRLNDICSLEVDFKNVTQIIALTSEEDDEIIKLSYSLSVPIMKFDNPDCQLKHGIVHSISRAYRNGFAVFNLNLYVFKDGVKSKLYDTCNSIETGLLLRSTNAILAKCPFIIQRVLLKNMNAENVILDENVNPQSYQSGKKHNAMSAFIYHLFDKFYYKRQWVLLYKVCKLPEYKNLNSFQSFLPPKAKFWADPFVLTYQNQQFVFFEEADSANNKGYISCSELSKEGLSEPVKVLETAYHLSFPNVFEFNNHIYMIPESAASNAIELWRCSSFPNQWELQCKLINNIKGVDTIIEFINNKWWLFTTVKPGDYISGNEELCIYYADNLITDQWIAHPKNPVLSDARMGRNAGKIERIDGKYFRYGQFSGYGYGKALAKSEILEISETEYRERLIDIVFPEASKGFDNLHTFNQNGNVAVGDALRRVKRFI